MKTFVIIKPDAIERGLIGRIISRFEDADFQITRMSMRMKNGLWFDRMYSHLEGTVFTRMRNFMIHCDLIGIVLEGERVIARVRSIIGCTDSVRATPGTIRGDFGSSLEIRYNCVHASDSEENATREIELFWDKETDYE
jgi:nucleoside-diphosphate kinase